MAIFVGRERELSALDENVEEALSGGGQLVLLSGEPGIGKTRLAEELTRRALTRDFLVTWGRAWEGEGTPAYYPWRQIVRRLSPSFESLFESTVREYPELSAIVGTRAQEDAGDPTEARFRMFDALAELLRLASREKPLVIVLDDLHTADVSTLDLLLFVARSIRSSARVLLVGTMRDAPASSRPLLAKIAREAVALPLGRLPRDAVATWVEHSAPELATNVDRLVSISEGNPLFVGELLASARKQPGQAWSSAQHLPLGVREAIRAHVQTLSDRAQEVLTRASVFGREFSTDNGPEIEEAIRAGVIVAAGDDERGRYRFSHVLIRDELYASLPDDRRAALHRDAALSERDPTLAAPHWLRGGREEDAMAVLVTLKEAMRDASARFAFEDAATIGERALETQTFERKDACELRIAVGEAWRLAGKVEPARAHGSKAAKEAQALDEAELLARAALVHATNIGVGGRDDATVDLLRAADDALPRSDSSIRAKVMARLSLALLPAPPDEHAGALRLAEDALAMARRLGDDETLFSVLSFTRETPSETLPASTRFALNAETLALAKKLGRVPHVASLFAWQVATCLDLGDIDAAVREVDAMETLLASYALPAYRYPPLLVRAMLADLEGRFSEADALNREAMKICEENGLVVPGLMLCVVQRTGFMYTRLDADAWNDIEPLAITLLDNNPLFAVYRATFDAPCGRVEKVRESLALTNGIPLETLPDSSGLAAPCAIAGIVEQAQRFYDLASSNEQTRGPWQFGPGRVVSMGPRALTLGRLAMLLGRKEDAIGHFERALAISERLRSRPYVSQAQLELARALATREEPKTKPAVKEGLVLVREGETWRIHHGGKVVTLKDTKGLWYLEALVAAPCREIHVLELAGQHQEGDAGPVLDERAKRAYRERADALRETLEEATRNGDLGHAERARVELDALQQELSRAVGLGNRDRRSVSPAERARINVQRRIRDVVARVRALDADLGEYLQLSVRTGLFCVYLPFEKR